MRRYQAYDGWGTGVLPDPDGQFLLLDDAGTRWVVEDADLRLALQRVASGLMTQGEAYDWLANNAATVR